MATKRLLAGFRTSSEYAFALRKNMLTTESRRAAHFSWLVA